MYTMNIFQLVKEYQEDYKTTEIKITDGYDFNQSKQLNTIELYYNSRFETGMVDSQGIEKAFYNINKSRVLVETRATDLDTKDIQIAVEDIDKSVQAMLFSKENKLWMKKSKFGVFLNKLGFTASKYGGAVVKKTMTDGLLELHIIPWRDLTTDQTDILSGVIMERHFYTPAQLKAMEGKWDNIDEAIKTADDSKANAYEDGTVETQGDYIEVWEIHGDMPETYLDEDGDENKFVKQMHVLAGVNETSDEQGDSEYVGVTLFAGKQKELPYKYFSREELAGRALGIGVVEDTEQSQIWTNKAVNEEKKVMELAGKIIFQQTGKGAVKNILTGIDNGTILDNKGNQITQLSTVPSSLPEFRNLVSQWDTQAERVTSTYAAATGESLPSGTPYRLGAILNQEANSQFDYIRERKGLFIEELYRDWILPYLKGRLKQEHVLVSDFSAEELAIIDKSFATYEVNRKIKDAILGGTVVSPEMIGQFQSQALDFIQKTGNKRGIKVPNDYYKGIEFQLDLLITNENKVKSVYLETLSNIMTTVAQNPNVLTDPKLSRIFSEIMQTAGFSPEKLAAIEQVTAQPSNVPQLQTSALQAEEAVGAGEAITR